MNATMSIRDYVAQRGFRVEIVRDRGSQVDADGWEHHAYVIRLHNGKGSFVETPWMQGYGIERAPDEQVAEVADSLISDVWSYQQAGSFEDWAEEFGYDTDSRKAEKIYRTVEGLADAVVALFGGQEQFEHVATEIERL